MFQHLDLILVNIVDDVLWKMINNMNGYSTNSTERLEHFLDFGLFESLPQMMWNLLRNDRIPAFFIELYSLLKSGEEKVPPGKVLVDFLGDSVPFLEVASSTIVAVELEIGGLDFTESRHWVDMVIEPDNFVVGDFIESDKLMIHFGS